jgi:hypothetical protein
MTVGICDPTSPVETGKGGDMLGEQIGELRGRRSGRRVLSIDSGFEVEVSFEEMGKMLGIEGGNIGTYSATARADGTLCGEGKGVFVTSDGDAVTWKGIATGRFTGGGAVAYRGALTYSTLSKKLAKLNAIAGVFEFEVDAEGNTLSKIWEWK